MLREKGYLSVDYQLDLFNTSRIKLKTPVRKDQLNYKEQAYVFKKSRNRIETLFSSFATNLKSEETSQNHSKSLKL